MNPDALQYILSTYQGREFISDVLSLCGVGAFAPSGNVTKDWYTLGRRSIGEDLLFAIRSQDGGIDTEYKILKEKQSRIESDKTYKSVQTY